MTDDTPRVASAALLRRPDGRLLLVRHRADERHLAGLWSLPLRPVAEDETAEVALGRLLRERLHVQPRACEFADTVAVADGDERYVLNIFVCSGWDGEPRFSEQHYVDAAWLRPGAEPPPEAVPELRRWLLDTPASERAVRDPATLLEALETARRELIAAYEAIPTPDAERPLPGGRSPLDLLARAASVEAYYAAESRRLLETPGHTWRTFNDEQWEAGHRLWAAETEAELRARLGRTRAETEAWVQSLTAEKLAAYGNHPQLGVVTVGDRIEEIARDDRAQAARLRDASPAATGARHAAADR